MPLPPDSDTSSLYTLSDSVRESLFRFQGERRLQNANEDYRWPCDSAAVRLELTVAAVADKIFENGLHFDPGGELSKKLSSTDGPVRCLDLGSGSTSAWVINMADRFPNAEIIGVDLVPSDLNYLPANVSIEVHDLLEGLPYPDEYFDLVHGRGTSGASFFDFNQSILPEISRILKPGGILLLEEFDNSHRPFVSSTLNNPHLDLVKARHNLRLDVIAKSRPQHLHRMTWGSRMTEEIRRTEGFREEEGGWVEDLVADVPLGYKKGAGPPEMQLGSLGRSMVLELWELHGVAIGMSEEMLASLREVDEAVLGEEEQGICVHLRTVYARKTDRLSNA